MVRLDEIFNLQMGKTPSRNNIDYWADGQYNWISIADFGAYQKYVGETKEKISALAIQESGIKCVPANTVIMSFKLSLGKTAITKNPVYTNEAIMAFIPTGRYAVLPDYFYYLFSARDWTKGTNRAVMGKTLNKATLSAISIEVPPLDEQRRIAATLDKVTDLISKRRQQLDKLDDLVKARFVEMFGILSNPSNTFKYDKLENLCRKITDGKHGGCTTQDNSGRYFVGAREIFDDSVHYETAPEITVDEFEKDYQRCNVEIGDMLIVNTGATIGKSAIASDSRTQNTLLQKSVALLKVKFEVLDAVFLQYCYKVNDSLYKVESASAQPNLLLSKIKSTLIYVPPIELQRQFSLFAEQTQKSKFAIGHSLEKLETLKKALMQEYFR